MKDENNNHKPIDEIIVNKLKVQREKLGKKLVEFQLQMKCKINFKTFLKDPKKKKRILIAVSAATVLVVGAGAFYYNITAYEYSLNGNLLGVVRNPKEVTKLIPQIKEDLEKVYDAEIDLSEKSVTFETVRGFQLDTQNKEEILGRFEEVSNIKVNASAILVNGKAVVSLAKEDDAKAVLNQLKAMYQNPDITYNKTYFLEKVAVKEKTVGLLELSNKDDALNFLLTGNKENQVHVVVEGETISEIAKKNHLKTSELMAVNQGLDPQRLKIGSELKLQIPKPFLTVATEQIATYQEAIPYAIEYENSAVMYEGESNVKAMGQNGVKDTTVLVQRYNGVEVIRTETASNLISAPISQVVLVGTKEKPLYVATGTLISPTRGSLSSRYGRRWNRQHAGIDIAASMGTVISAADGGTVVSSGWRNGYGYAVEIDHGDGKRTLYGHCSKLAVSSGDKVYQGQYIANVGNTGNSTGPHLHFEVKLNGVTQNPLDYVSY